MIGVRNKILYHCIEMNEKNVARNKNIVAEGRNAIVERCSREKELLYLCRKTRSKITVLWNEIWNQ